MTKRQRSPSQSTHEEDIPKKRKRNLVGVDKYIPSWGGRKFPILKKTPFIKFYKQNVEDEKGKIPSFLYYYNCMVCDDGKSFENEYSAMWLLQPRFQELALTKHCYSFFNKNQLFKEASEAGALLSLLDEHLDDHIRKVQGEDYHIFDVGGGKGYLSVMLAEEFPKATIHLVDASLGKMNRQHFQSFPSIKLHPTWVGTIKQKRNLLKDIIKRSVPAGKKIILLGSHLCTDLGEHFIDTMAENDFVQACIFAPCCIRKHKKNEPYFTGEEKCKASYPQSLPRADETTFTPYERWATYLYDKLAGIKSLKQRQLFRLVDVLSAKDLYVLAERDSCHLTQKDIDTKEPLSNKQKKRNKKNPSSDNKKQEINHRYTRQLD